MVVVVVVVELFGGSIETESEEGDGWMILDANLPLHATTIESQKPKLDRVCKRQGEAGTNPNQKKTIPATHKPARRIN